MLAVLRKMTGNNLRLLLAPTLWAFIENVFTMIPAILIMMVMGALVEAIAQPDSFNADLLLLYCFLMALTIILQLVVSILSYRYSYYNGQKAVASIRQSIVERMRRLSLGYFSSAESGHLIETFVTDPDEMEKATSFYLPQVISMGFMSILSFGILLYYDWRLALPMYAMLPLCLVCMWVAMKFRAKQANTVAEARTHATTSLNEYVLGMKNLKSYNQAGRGFTRLDESYCRLRREKTREEGVPGALTLLAAHMVSLGIPLIIFVGSMMLINGQVELFWFLAFLVLSTRLYTPLSTSITCLIQARTSLVSANRVQEVTQHPEQEGENILNIMGDICFDDVCFAYKDELVLNHVHATAPWGKLTALVGPSGSGKSTMLRLIARFWDVDSGRILIGNKDIAYLDPESLYGSISMVFQENYLFGESIRANILFGQDDKTEGDMVAAAKLACCHQFITELPLGYETLVGEGGATLSGGEKQRIAIARAILKDAPILLLDEPTSNLDAQNEVMVQQAISNLVSGRTVIMIAHRLKTIAEAERIIVLDEGRVRESGDFEELMNRKDGLFQRLWNLQMQAQGWSIENE